VPFVARVVVAALGVRILGSWFLVLGSWFLVGGVVEWWSGGVVEWWSGGVVEWWSGGVVEWWSGRGTPFRQVAGLTIDSSPPHGVSPFGHGTSVPVQTTYKPSVVLMSADF